MLVLHHPDTLLHRTVELLGAKIIPAMESPERISNILKALQEDGTHELHIEPYNRWSANDVFHPSPQDEVKQIIISTHDPGYIRHLQTAHRRWVDDGLIEETESVLPECFRIPSITKGTPENPQPPFDIRPPKDIYAQAGYYAFDMSTGISKDTWTSIHCSANLAARAASYITPSSPRSQPSRKDVLALCRPPGHHCNTAVAGGYCYVNNVVVAIEALARRKIALHPPHGPHRPRPERSGLSNTPRVAVLDLDFHHGNGTQDVYYKDPTVLYVSIHGEDEFPYYTGFASETGSGAGKGYTLNLPLRVGASFAEYCEKLEVAVKKVVEFGPEFLVVSLGFDTFRLDPIGKFDIDVKDYEAIAARVRGTRELRDVPCVIVLEGGYVVEQLGECMLSFLRGWEKDR